MVPFCSLMSSQSYDTQRDCSDCLFVILALPLKQYWSFDVSINFFQKVRQFGGGHDPRDPPLVPRLFLRNPNLYLREFWKKLLRNSERLGRQAWPGIEPGNSCLPTLSAEPIYRWWDATKKGKRQKKEKKGEWLNFRRLHYLCLTVTHPSCPALLRFLSKNRSHFFFFKNEIVK